MMGFTEVKFKKKAMKIAQDIIPLLDPHDLDTVIATLVFLNQYYWNRHYKRVDEEVDIDFSTGWQKLEL